MCINKNYLFPNVIVYNEVSGKHQQDGLVGECKDSFLLTTHTHKKNYKKRKEEGEESRTLEKQCRAGVSNPWAVDWHPWAVDQPWSSDLLGTRLHRRT